MNTQTNTQGAIHPDYKKEIAAIINSNLTPHLTRERLVDYHENDIASILPQLHKDARVRLYSILGTDRLADILEYVDEPSEILCELNVKKRVEVLSRVEAGFAVEYLNTLEKQERNALMALMDSETRKEIGLFASFDRDEIGSRMSTDYIAVCSGIGVRQAMTALIEQAAENDNISTIYVIDGSGTYLGAIYLKDLIRARETTPLDSIIMTSYPYVYSDELIDDCIDRIREYSEDSIPVLDTENNLTGILTAQEISELFEDEIGDDYAKLGGLSAEEDLREPLRKSIGKRLPWLCALFGMGLIVSGVVGIFEEIVANLSLIVSFQSLILGMAGNTGTQSLAVTIRALLDENLTPRQKAHLVFKEARVGASVGLVVGGLSFGLIGLYLYYIKEVALTLAFTVSFCTAAALFISMLLSSISGTSIPMLFKKLKIDPAVASGPFITTLNDLVAVVTYYGLAWMMLTHLI